MAQNILVRLMLDNTSFGRQLNNSRARVEHFGNSLTEMGRAAGGSTGGAIANLAKGLGGLGSKAAALAGPLGVAVAAVGALGAAAGAAAKRWFGVVLKFEEGVQQMKALTGATEEQLDGLKKDAINLSRTGSASASEILGSMQKVAGAMPELLKRTDKLGAVTEAAMTLSVAGGLELEEAITALTGIMNQYGASADDAMRYTNALGAAAQAGSAEIPYLRQAVEKSAGAARSAGIGFEELLGLIEAVAPKFADASEAGTALRGVLLAMETGAEDCKISTQGLDAALEAMSGLSTDEVFKRFGKQGFNMAKAMIEAREGVKGFREEVTGTNSAQEQAAIISDTVNARVAELQNAWDALTLTIKDDTGALKDWVAGLADVVNGLSTAVEQFGAAETAGRLFFEYMTGQWRQMAALAQGEFYVIGEDTLAAGKEQAERFKKREEGARHNGAQEGKKQVEWVKLMAQNKPVGSVTDEDLLRDALDGLKLLYDAKRPKAMSKQQKTELGAWYNGAYEEIVKTFAPWELEPDKMATATATKEQKSKPKPATPRGAGTTAKPSALETLLTGKGVDTKAALEAVRRVNELREQLRGLDEVIEAMGGADAAGAAQFVKLREEVQKTLEGIVGAPKVEADLLRGLDVGELEKKRAALEALRKDLKRAEELLEANPGNAELTAKVAELKSEIEKTVPPAQKLAEVVAGFDLSAFADAEQSAKKLREEFGRLQEVIDATGGNDAMKRAALVMADKLNTDKTQHYADPNGDIERLARLREIKRQEEEIRALKAGANAEELALLERKLQGLGAERRGAAVDRFTGAAGTIANFGSTTSEVLEIAGLDKASAAVTKAVRAINVVIGVIQAVQGVIALFNAGKAVELMMNSTALAVNTGALVANTTAVSTLAAVSGTTGIIKSIIGFSDGGVVGGNSYTGDRLFARINSGEMVLNKRQQRNLAAGLDAALSGGGLRSSGGRVVSADDGRGVVRGEDIYVALRAYMDRTGARIR